MPCAAGGVADHVGDCQAQAEVDQVVLAAAEDTQLAALAVVDIQRL